MARQEWQAQAQEVVDEAMDSEQLDRLRADAAEKLATMRAEVDAINDALRVDADDFDLPELVVPDAVLNGESNGLPLIDSGWSFVDQCRRLIDHKAYRLAGGNGHAGRR